MHMHKTLAPPPPPPQHNKCPLLHISPLLPCLLLTGTLLRKNCSCFIRAWACRNVHQNDQREMFVRHGHLRPSATDNNLTVTTQLKHRLVTVKSFGEQIAEAMVTASDEHMLAAVVSNAHAWQSPRQQIVGDKGCHHYQNQQHLKWLKEKFQKRFILWWTKLRQELCESHGGSLGLPVPNSPYGLYGCKSTLNLNSDEPCTHTHRSALEDHKMWSLISLEDLVKSRPH